MELLDRVLYTRANIDQMEALLPFTFNRSRLDNHIYLFSRTFAVLWSVLYFGGVPKDYKGSEVSLWSLKLTEARTERLKLRGASQHCRVTPAPGGGRDRMNYEDTLRFLIYGFRRAAWDVLIRSDIEACQLLEQGCKEWSFKPELLQSFCQLLQNEHENCCREDTVDPGYPFNFRGASRSLYRKYVLGGNLSLPILFMVNEGIYQAGMQTIR